MERTEHCPGVPRHLGKTRGLWYQLTSRLHRRTVWRQRNQEPNMPVEKDGHNSDIVGRSRQVAFLEDEFLKENTEKA